VAVVPAASIRGGAIASTIILGLALSVGEVHAADPLGTAPTYASRALGPIPNERAITRRIWAPGLDDGYVPQGLAVVAGALYVASYRSVDVKQDRGPCRLFRLDMTSGATTAALDLPASCGHAGGLARGPAGRLLVADTRTLYEIELTQGPGLGRVVRAIKLLGNVKGSSAAGSADALWLGTFARDPGAKLFKIPFGALKPTVNEADATQTLTLPTEVQGAAFDAAGQLWITRSTSRFGELRRLDPASGATQAQYAMPIGMEDLSFDANGGLWTVSEAGSRRWLRWATFFPIVFRLDPVKLR
jgi:hypothetical protein